MRNKENDSTQTRHINKSNAVWIYSYYEKGANVKAMETFSRKPYGTARK